MVLQVYGFAAFHKLNTYFLSPTTSPAALFARLLWPRCPLLMTRMAIVTIIVAEVAVPILMLHEGTAIFGAILATGLHYLFGIAYNSHFSVVMLCGLSAFWEEPPSLAEFFAHGGLAVRWITACAVGGVFVLATARWGLRQLYSHRRLAYAEYAIFGVLVGSALALYCLGRPACYASVRSRWDALGVGINLFFLNSASPYLGWKSEFSMAMFSGLRPDVDCHLVLKLNIRSRGAMAYVVVLSLSGLPHATTEDDPVASWVFHELSQWRESKFSYYFFKEAMLYLYHKVDPPVEIDVVYTDGTETFTISDYCKNYRSDPTPVVRMVLYPPSLSISPKDAHLG